MEPEESQKLDSASLPSLDGYELIELLGKGPIGSLFKARQLESGRLVTIKLLDPHIGLDELSRMRKAATAADKIDHRTSLRYLEVACTSEMPYLASEFVDGRSLKRLLADGLIAIPDAVKWTQHLAIGLHAAHTLGVVHGNLKPANILVSTTGDVRIRDYGLAGRVENPEKHSQPSFVRGAIGYMSPEQAQGDGSQPEASSDVFSLGAVFFELLTGRPPFRGETGWKTVTQTLSGRPVSVRTLHPDVPRELDSICRKCLHRSADRRYSSAQDLADDLGRYLGHMPVRAQPPRITRRALAWAQQNRLGALAIVALSAALVFTSWMLLKRSDRPVAAERPVKSPSETQPAEQPPKGENSDTVALDELMSDVSEDWLNEVPTLRTFRRTLLKRALARQLQSLKTNDAASVPAIQGYLRAAGLHRALGDHRNALTAYRISLTLGDELSPPRSDLQLAAHLGIARTRALMQDVGPAQRAYLVALKHFDDGEDSNREDRPSNALHGRILYEYASVLYASGDASLARKKLLEAIEILEYQRLHGDNPRDLRMLTDLANAYSLLATVHGLYGSQNEQQLVLLYVEKLFRGLSLARPDRLDLALALGDVNVRQGRYHLNALRTKKSRERIDQALAVLSRLRAQFPQAIAVQIAEANALSAEAAVLAVEGQRDSAAKGWTQALRLLEASGASGTTQGKQTQVAILLALSRLLADHDQVAAEARAEDALRIAEKVEADLAGDELVAQVLLQRSEFADSAKAIAMLERAAKVLQGLLNRRRNSPRLQLALAATLSSNATRQIGSDTKKASALFDRAAELIDRVAEIGLSPQAKRLLFTVFRNRAELRLADKDHKACKEIAVEIGRVFPADWDALYTAASLTARCGELASEDAKLSKEEQSYQSQAYWKLGLNYISGAYTLRFKPTRKRVDSDEQLKALRAHEGYPQMLKKVQDLFDAMDSGAEKSKSKKE